MQLVVPATAIALALAALLSTMPWVAGDADAIANAATCETTHAGLDADEATVVDAINAERVAAGLPPYLVSAALSQAAAWMAEDFASSSGPPSHVDSTGRWPAERGADCVGIGGMGEVLAWGSLWTPDNVVSDGWMQSPG